ncbi:MAG: beta-N-acetylhexosaminidase [Candidatus Eremiobacteraeota bacterium]|nr:beta-N-acetylhexosaminidase [Candidatus Eremiobacteraeota bacterium]MBV9055417.1 beta-N-acetylhexosaminidase [Candidatus Eremiobacteraeota bacterium]
MAAQVAIAAALLHLVPRPSRVELLSCAGGSAAVPRSVSASFDPAARAELDERWSALGIGVVTISAAQRATILVRYDPSLPPQGYRLRIDERGASIASADAAGAFYGAMTLAQMPTRMGGEWRVPCARIEDRPALEWRILSDDVSRGPLPTMRYFKERIRTIAAFKMNGYSPYMEHVFVSPTDPLPAPLDGITPAQLRELAAYARQFHVALIPEQQTFAHMHNTLRVEQYAAAAELPHGFLLAPDSALTLPYLSRIIAQELAAVGRPAFFHIGSDETATLGAGQTREYVARRGRSRVYADHIVAMNRVIAPSGARLMLWDDGIENDPGILRMIPQSSVVVNWHYGAEHSFMPYIATIARGGFEQMLAPGASNWNEIFPNVDRALRNARTFIGEGKAARVLGLFATVWHDDGETLYEATWYPVLYAAASAWHSADVTPEQFARDFPAAFFGTADGTYAADVARLGDILLRLEPPTSVDSDPSDVLFWQPPLKDDSVPQFSSADLRAVRLEAEAVQGDRYFVRPPLHANAAAVMFLAARRYDLLARKFQIAQEVRAMYADAAAHAATDSETTQRDLRWCRYWMWELRDAYEELAPLYAAAWNYESRAGHLESNLERYHLAAQRAIALSDAFYRAAQQYDRTKTLPAFAAVATP